MMINYQYDLENVEKNSEKYLSTGFVSVCDAYTQVALDQLQVSKI